ncbi:MAG: hypothetical protein K6D94_00755 [Clostridiales bacterium]|nr:hypothetical protein [Clostridiales bacterium]
MDKKTPVRRPEAALAAEGAAAADAKKKNKKRALIILISAVALMFVLLLLNGIDWQGAAAKAVSIGKQEEKDFYFWPVNYDVDIFLDSQYMDKNRYISYTDGAETTLITDGSYSLYGPAVALLAEYIDAVTMGDAERLNALFTEEYWGTHKKYERFTMQRIYNCELKLISSAVLTEGKYKGANRWTFDVRYMIMKNDGTFRRDMESDSAVPQVFEILSDGVNTLINSVSEYSYIVLD